MSKMSTPGPTHTQTGSTSFVLRNTTPALMSWIHSGIHMLHIPNCAILMIGPNGKEMEKLTFDQPSLISVTLPAMSNVIQIGSYASLSVIIHTHMLTTISETTQTPPTATSKSWAGNKFKLSITGMDCSGVTKVSSILYHNSTWWMIVEMRRMEARRRFR